MSMQKGPPDGKPCGFLPVPERGSALALFDDDGSRDDGDDDNFGDHALAPPSVWDGRRRHFISQQHFANTPATIRQYHPFC